MLQSVVSKSSRHAVQSKAFRAVSSSSFAALKKKLTQSGNTKDPTSSVTGVAAFFFLIFLFFFPPAAPTCFSAHDSKRTPAFLRFPVSNFQLRRRSAGPRTTPPSCNWRPFEVLGCFDTSLEVFVGGRRERESVNFIVYGA